MQKIIKWINLIPLFWLINFLIFCTKATNKLGALPKVYYPDPKDLNLDFYYYSVWILGSLSLFLSVPVVLVYDFILLKNGESSLFKILKSRIWIWSFIACLLVNPLDLINWFLD